MKRLLQRSLGYSPLLSVLCLTLWLGGCNFSAPTVNSSPTTQETTKNGKKKVILTTFTVLADMTQNIAGDKATVESLTKIGAEIHGYEPTPSDIVKAQKADLILDNGFGLERWAQRFYGNLKNVPSVTLSDGITPINISEDAYQGKPNPHAWMSPKLALIYVENIRKALVNLDPENRETYDQNAKSYSEKIRQVDRILETTINQISPNKRYIVSCEGAFSYLARDYQLKEVYLWPVNSEQQSTPQQVQKVINAVKKNKIPAIFCESTVSAEAQKQVVKSTGTRFGGVFYVDSLSQPDGIVPTYLDLMQYNVNTLVKGLKNE